MTRLEADLWGWFHNFYYAAVSRGDRERQQLAQLHWDAWETFETQPRHSLVLLDQGRALADRLHEPCWVLFYDYWRCEAYLYYLHEHQNALDLAVKTAVEARKPQYSHCPVLARVYRILVDVYFFTDPIGYADKIRETVNYMEAEVSLDSDTRLLLIARRASLAHAFDQLEEATAIGLQYLAASENNAFRQTHAYLMLCEYSYRNGDCDAALGYARAGEVVARQSQRKASVSTLLACQALLHRMKGEDEAAQRCYRQATTRYTHLGVKPSSLFYDMVCAYHEQGGEPEAALRLRDRELEEAMTYGSPNALCYCRLRRCRLLGRMGRPLDEELAAAREAAQKLIDPSRFLAKLERVVQGDYSDRE